MKDHTNINNSNEDLDPSLNRSGNKNPFRTEADYFDSFSEKLNNRIGEYEELSAEAPLLSNIPKYNPFDVPKDYFDELPTLVQAACIEETGTSLIDWLRMIFRPAFALPVLTVLLIAFVGIRYMNKTNSRTKEFAEEISVEEQLQGIDESTIIDALASVSPNVSSADAENENIKDYLLDNNIDESNLNEL